MKKPLLITSLAALCCGGVNFAQSNPFSTTGTFQLPNPCQQEGVNNNPNWSVGTNKIFSYVQMYLLASGLMHQLTAYTLLPMLRLTTLYMLVIL